MPDTSTSLASLTGLPLSSDSSSASSSAGGLDEVGQAVHQPGALGRRGGAPRSRERGAGGLHGAVDVLGAGLGDGGDRATGRRIEGLERGAAGGGDELAVDQQPVLAPGEGAGGVGELFGERGDGHADTSGQGAD